MIMMTMMTTTSTVNVDVADADTSDIIAFMPPALFRLLLPDHPSPPRPTLSRDARGLAIAPGLERTKPNGDRADDTPPGGCAYSTAPHRNPANVSLFLSSLVLNPFLLYNSRYVDARVASRTKRLARVARRTAAFLRTVYMSRALPCKACSVVCLRRRKTSFI